jgi:hypothetical protein
VRGAGRPSVIVTICGYYRTSSPVAALPMNHALELRASSNRWMASDLNNGTTENPPLLKGSAGLLDLFQGISVGHQLP